MTLLVIAVNLLFLCAILGLLYWALKFLKVWEKLPDGLRRIIVVIVVLLVAIWLIGALQGGVQSRYLIYRF